MLRSKLLTSIVLLSVSFGCAKQKVENNTPVAPADSPKQPRNSVDVVKATGLPASIKPNDSSEATVEVHIQNGYHVNANPPTFNYLKATELELNQTPGISVGFIVYPTAITKSFPFATKPLAVYEGTVKIKVRLKADKTLKVGSQNLSGHLKIQACDDQVCYAPGTLDVSIPLSIK